MHWGRNLVARKVDVADEVVVKWRIGEGGDWLRDALAGGLDGNVIVLLEVDTSVLLRWVVRNAKELTLETLVGWPRDVLSVPPLSVS